MEWRRLPSIVSGIVLGVGLVVDVASAQVAQVPERAELVRTLMEHVANIRDGKVPEHRGPAVEALRAHGKTSIELIAGELKKTKTDEGQCRLIRAVADIGLGSQPVVDLLAGFIEAEGRTKLKISVAMRGYKDRPGPVAAIALGELAPFVTGDRERMNVALEHELRERYGFHIAKIRRGFFRGRVDASAPIDELMTQLGDDIPYVREAAAEALGSRGAAARKAIDALAEALTEDHPQKIKVNLGGWSGSSSANWNDEIQRAAARAMVRIAPADRRCGAAHIHVIRNSKDAALLTLAARHVGMLGEEAEPAIARLCSLVEHEDVRLAAEAVTALGMIGIGREEVLDALKKAAARPERQVAARAKATARMLTRNTK